MALMCAVRAATGTICFRVVALMLGLVWIGGAPARAVYYEDVPDAPITYDGLVLRFVGAEIFMQRQTITYPDRTRTITYALPSFGDSGVAVQDKGSFEPVALALGEPAGPHLEWTRQNGRLVYVTCPIETGAPCESTGAFAGRVAYLGLVFRNELGAYYGWARFGQAGGDALTILYDFGIETTPNMPILAGSRETLPDLVRRALRCAAGIETPTAEDLALLDHAGEAGRLDLPDAVALVRIMAPLVRPD